MGSRKTTGVTLIELLVALAIVGVLLALGTTALRQAFDVPLKNTARRLASTLRYLQNKAVTDNLTLRIGFDLDEQRYWVEQSREPHALIPSSESPREVETSEEEEEASEPSPFTGAEERLLKPEKFPSGVFLKDIQTAYLEEKKETGQVFLYFFPDGFVTGATIHLRDEDDETHFTLFVRPLTRRVRIEAGYLEEPGEEPQ